MLRVAAMMVMLHVAAMVVPGTARTAATVPATGVGVVCKTHYRQNGDQYSTNSLRHLYVPLNLRTVRMVPSGHLLGQKIAKMGDQGKNARDFLQILPTIAVARYVC